MNLFFKVKFFISWKFFNITLSDSEYVIKYKIMQNVEVKEDNMNHELLFNEDSIITFLIFIFFFNIIVGEMSVIKISNIVKMFIFIHVNINIGINFCHLIIIKVEELFSFMLFNIIKYHLCKGHTPIFNMIISKNRLLSSNIQDVKRRVDDKD